MVVDNHGPCATDRSRVRAGTGAAAERAVTDVDRTRYVLSEEENEQIFRARIVPQQLAGT